MKGLLFFLSCGIALQLTAQNNFDQAEIRRQISLEDTNQLLDSYVEAVDTDLDKEHIKIELRKLYTEAQNLEVV